MVFEAVVVEVLNRFLKEYVVNLDPSQLKLGIWGGDVVLNDLIIRDTALNDLNLPIKVLWGQLGKLMLKIPWKNLYGSPVIACVENLFLIISPESEIRFEEEKEERWKQELKQSELRRIEDAKKREAEKDAPKVDDTFVEKLVAQIIRNIQINIQNIHIRYEDRTTHPGSPFSFGATISTLSVETTTEIIKPHIDPDNTSFIFKILKLHGLSIYWNPSSDLISSLTTPEIIAYLKRNIPSEEYTPSNYNYMFGPIASSAKLVLNQKPETDGSNFKNPKVELDINMDEFSIAITRRQFQDVMLLVDNWAALSKAFPFRKYRPPFRDYRGNFKTWWKYAYNCVLVEIQRRRNDWNWNHICEHRQLCREYQSCYQKKLMQKCPPDVEARVAELEKILDVFNIVLLRERAAVEAERLELLKKEESANRGWFGGWFSRSKPATESEKFTADIAKKIEIALTPEEKKNLYRAIDYQENTAPTYYPPHFIQFLLKFKLKCSKVRVWDDIVGGNPLVLDTTLNNFLVSVEQRPSASALKARISFGDFSVLGMKQPTGVPQIVKSRCYASETLIDILYETNPLDGLCDQRIHITARPLSIIYNSETVNRLHDIFTSYDSDNINEIKERTSASLPTFKQMSAVGLQFAIERRARLDINIKVSASSIIVPYRGVFLPNSSLLVIRLGTLLVVTKQQKSANEVSVKQMFLQGTTEDEIFKTIVSESYTTFNCQLTGVQALISLEGEDWVSALKSDHVTPLHLLQPTSLELDVKKSLITDDARIPKIIIEGNLPSIQIHVMEERLLAAAALFYSLPRNREEVSFKESFSSSMWSVATAIEARILEAHDYGNPSPEETSQIVQGTNLVCNFSMKEFVVNLYKPDASTTKLNFVKMSLNLLNIEVVQKTFERSVKLYLAGIDLMHWHLNEQIPMISTETTEKTEYLFAVDIINCDPHSPDFYSARKGVLQHVDLKMSRVKIVLHQDALLSQISFVNALNEKIVDVKKQTCVAEEDEDSDNEKAPARRLYRKRHAAISEGITKRKVMSGMRRKKTKEHRVVVIDLLANISLDEISLTLIGKEPLTLVTVKGIDVASSSRKSYTTYDIKLKNFTVFDLNQKTLYKTIVTSADDKQTISILITMYNEDFRMPDDIQMSINVRISQIRLVYLYRFLANIIEFSNKFQAAKEAVKEASTAAAEKAKQNVMKVYEDAARISLDIDIKAPLIFVPLNSESRDALVIDLGVLSMNNHFSTLQLDQDYPAAIDNMNLKLDHLTLIRASVDSKEVTVIYEYPLIKPVSMSVSVKRNLSASWFKKIPDIDLNLQLDQFEIALDQQDYAFCMSVLQENHAEVDKRHTEEKVVIEQNPAVADREATAEEAKEASDNHVTLLFTFALDTFIITLITGGVLSLNEKTHLERQKKPGLARFVLETLAVKGKILLDGSMNMSVKLVNCILEDIRSSQREGVTTLMERKSISDDNTSYMSKSGSSMLDVTYKKSPSEQFIDVRVLSFMLVISMDYFMKVGAFFSVERQKAPPPVQTQKISNMRKEKVHSKSPRVQPASDNSSKTSMVINLRLEKPDIMIVENMDDINTEALVFHTELLLKYRQTFGKQLISGSLTDFQLYCCSFNPAARNKTKVQVIKPVTLSIEGSTPEDCGPHVEFQCTPIHISVSPTTIQLLNACYRTLMQDPTADPSGREEDDWRDLWSTKTFKDSDYWFLTPEVGLEALELIDTNEESIQTNLDEQCIIKIPSVIITVEAGIGRRTVPMLLLEFSIVGQARNWSSKLAVDCSVSVGMNYYNSCLATWEPIVEPIDCLKNGKPGYEPWRMSLEVTKKGVYDIGPTMNIHILSKDTLELTATKTCLEVLNNLADSFSNAVTTSSQTSPGKSIPVYIIKNNCGLNLHLLLGSSKLQYGYKFQDCVHIDVYNDTEMTLTPPRSSLPYASSAILTALSDFEINDTYLTVKFPDSVTDPFDIPLGRRSKRCYVIPVGPKRDKWTIVVDITAEQYATYITFRSVVRVINHFHVPIHIYYVTKRENEVEYVGTVEPMGAFNVPPYALYTRTGEFFFGVDGYSISIIPFSWHSLQTEVNTTIQIQCKPKNKDDTNPFFIKVLGELERAYYQNTLLRTIASRCYNIHLQPTVEFFNSLPTNVILCTEGSIDELFLNPGDKVQLPSVDPTVSYITVRLPNYLDREWACWTDISHIQSDGCSVWIFDSHDGTEPETLHLGVSATIVRGTVSLILYCPFWMINKTGFLLSYSFDVSSQVIYHPVSYSDPIMLSPAQKCFTGKKKGMIKVDQGHWSDKFSLDVAGSGGLVHCKSQRGHILTLSITIRLSQNNLTKIIVITPGHVVVNKTEFVLEVREECEESMKWQKLQPDDCASLWPRHGHDTRMCARIAGTEEITPLFYIHSTYSCLLRLNNKHGGIFVDVQNTASGVYISLFPYEPGLAPVLLFNHTSEPMVLWEKGNERKIGLAPNCLRLYAWEKPSGPRQIVWRNEKNEEVATALNEDFSDTIAKPHGARIFCSSFLDGMQRILLFTEDERVAIYTHGPLNFANPDQEIKIDIQAMGLSIVNNISQKELVYMGLVSSGIIWEERKPGTHRRYKPLNALDSELIEKEYTKYLDRLKTDNPDPIAFIDNRLKISFENMEILQPQRRDLRRTFSPGLRISYVTFEHSNILHCLINRLQIDNQMYNCIYPVILAPVPPPKTVAADYQQKPFMELSIFKRLTAHSTVQQFKYFKMLIQEFHVKLDIGFLQAFFEFLAVREPSDDVAKTRFLKDLELSKAPLHSHVSVISSQEHKNVYELLHFSPLKIHLSFSLAGNADSKNLPNALTGIFQGLGVTLTDINDAVFRLNCMERKNAFMTVSQLQNEAISHYLGQALRQAYVIIFGLDVIGNPFGLVVGISEGVEALFYEPFQGMIQGPADFAEGLSLGMRSLFGHTVGGAAGAFGRITGTIGKGLAVLSLDKEYQQKRKEQQKQRGDNLQMQIAQGGKGLVMGVVEGVTGVVTKPYSGAKQEGVGGFLKGMGKGVVGLVTRPVSGVVDFASTSFNAVKKATDMTEEATRLRPPRFFRDNIVTPYRFHEAYGSKFLHELANGKYAATDKYETHTKLKEKELLILSNKRIIIAILSDVFGTWQDNFVVTWSDLVDEPILTAKGIVLNINKKKSSVFSPGKETKIICIVNSERENILRVMRGLYAAEQKTTSR